MFRGLVVILFLMLSSFSFCKQQDRRPILPYITGDAFRAICDHVFDTPSQRFDPTKVKHGDTIYVPKHFVENFLSKFHKEIPNPYILVTHNSDGAAPGKARKYLNDPKILYWFAQNIEDSDHPKLHPLPIGVENRYKRGEVFPTFMEKNPVNLQEKSLFLYLNINPNSYMKERKHVINLFQKEPYTHHVKNRKSYIEYLHDLQKSIFVLSPRGNGLDCHRTWEALYAGAIPIVCTSKIDSLFKGLPVIIVKAWEEINEEFLNDQLERLQQRFYSNDYQKIYMEYWVNKINEHKIGCTCLN